MTSIFRWCFAALLVALPVACGDDEGGGGDGGMDADTDTDTDTDTDADTDTDTDTDTDSDTGAGTDSDGSWDGDLAAEISCNPSGDPCAALEVDDAIHASYRKDYWLPESLYPESSLEWSTEPPLGGGRFHVVALAAASGEVTEVRINGTPTDQLLDGSSGTPLIEWYHVWPDPVVAGEPIWVAFHSRSADWDTAASGQIAVSTSGGEAVDASFDVAQTTVPLTYVTLDDSLDELIIHLKNTGDSARTVERLLVDGRDVLAADVACVPSTTIAPGESVMWTVPLCEPVELGDSWSVVVALDGGEESVAGGRALRPFFPIETWPRGSDCPEPGGNETYMNNHFDAGFDTFYVYFGDDCSSHSTTEIINTVAPAMEDDYNVLLGDDFKSLIDNETAAGLFTDFSRVAGLLTGDESDGEIYEESGDPVPEGKARYARWMWRNYPAFTVYNGAKTNKNVGTFAGMTDVQGIDLYIAGCAPWITGVNPPPIRASYDYLKNARDNHMPWPSWQYSQGLGSWDGQPAPAEIYVQAFSVMAGGGKGLMWFQSPQELAAEHPDTWQAISNSNWVFRAVRDRLREGDPTGMAAAGGETIVEMVRASDALVVVVISIANSGGPTLTSCGLASLELADPHWNLTDQSVDVSVEVPPDFPVAEAFEIPVGGGDFVDLGYDPSLSGRQISFQDVPLGPTAPVRIFVLAADETVRDEMAALHTP
ncbi:MAG: hypothetical protein R6V85_13550 [Polyangia bacterium]